MRWSLAICGGTYAVIGAFALAMRTGVFESPRSLVVNILFYPIGVFTMFSGFFALAAMLLGALELKTDGFNAGSLAAVLASVPVVIGYAIALKILWPALMGI
jgi:hypothetical protein